MRFLWYNESKLFFTGLRNVNEKKRTEFYREHFLNGRSQADIAKELGITGAAVSQFKKRHAKELDAYDDEKERYLSLFEAVIDAVVNTPVVIGGTHQYIENIHRAIDEAAESHHQSKTVRIPFVMHIKEPSDEA